MTPKEQMSFEYGEEVRPPEAEAPKPKEEAVRAEEPSSAVNFAEGEDECQYCGAPFESERSCRYCATNYIKREYLEKLAQKSSSKTPTRLEEIMERLRNDPQNARIKDNDNAIREKARIVMSRKPGPQEEPQPWPRLDN